MKIRSSERWQKIDSIFSGALPLSPEARRQFLDESCGSDDELRAELQQLLHASDTAGEFLEKLDVTAAASLLETSDITSGSIGRHKVIRKIGAGGMGVVYLAEDPALKRPVAVKLLPPWLHSSSRANRRLLEEARAASAIDHPNIATVHEIGETEDGRLFITMSYYEGDTLRDRIARGRVPVDTAIDITTQVARGLAAAHRKGIIHRDIKPENLLITPDGIVKIVDFGLASIEMQATASGTTPAGTAAYMSPEQATGAALDARTDVWSLGVVLYEMLAGVRPFTGGETSAIILSGPAKLRDIAGRCLEKDPAARYASAELLIKDLDSVRGGVVADATSAGGSGSRNGGRRRATVLGATALLMLGAIGTAAAWRNSRGSNSGTVQESLAVLPFVDMSPNADREFISDGMTEELISALATIDQLRVVARSSAFQFKGKTIDIRKAGEKLGVAHILEGSVRSSGDRLRIAVRLVDAARGHEVWSETFERSDRDILAVQAEIAASVATALRVKLDPAKRGSVKASLNPDAHALYLKGRRLYHQQTNLEQAIRLFREAIGIDPSFARAWTALGRTWLVMPVYTSIPFPQALDSAESAIRKALSIDPGLADAHATLGSMLADDWQWSESEPHFVRALQLGGGDATTHQWYGEMLFRVGRVDEAITRFKTAEQIDPLLSVIPMVLGFAYLYTDARQEALSAFNEAAAIEPRDVQAHVGIGYALIATGRINEAIPALEKAVELANGGMSTRAHLARGYALAGRRPEAIRIFTELKAEAPGPNGSAWSVAVVAASLGLTDETFRWLEQAYTRREIGIGYLKTSEAFKPLRSDPRFVAILTKIGLN